MIVEQEQEGQQKAEYGKELLKHLSEELTKEFGKGYSHRNLEYLRKLHLTYSTRISQILFAKIYTRSKNATKCRLSQL